MLPKASFEIPKPQDYYKQKVIFAAQITYLWNQFLNVFDAIRPSN